MSATPQNLKKEKMVMNKFGWAIAIALLLATVLGLMFSGRNDVTAAPNVVNTFNTRSGNVTLTSSDVTSALTFTPADQADLTATNTICLTTISRSQPQILGLQLWARWSRV